MADRQTYPVRRFAQGTGSDMFEVMREVGKLEHPHDCPDPRVPVHRWVLVWDGTDQPRWHCVDCYPLEPSDGR